MCCIGPNFFFWCNSTCFSKERINRPLGHCLRLLGKPVAAEEITCVFDDI